MRLGLFFVSLMLLQLLRPGQCKNGKPKCSFLWDDNSPFKVTLCPRWMRRRWCHVTLDRGSIWDDSVTLTGFKLKAGILQEKKTILPHRQGTPDQLAASGEYPDMAEGCLEWVFSGFQSFRNFLLRIEWIDANQDNNWGNCMEISLSENTDFSKYRLTLLTWHVNW